jgi:hypothetical protein
MQEMPFEGIGEDIKGMTIKGLVKVIKAALVASCLLIQGCQEARAESGVTPKELKCRQESTIAATECPPAEPEPYKKCFDDTRKEVFNACMGLEEELIDGKPQTP